MANDKNFLMRAIKIAHEGIRNGGGPFGAVITIDNKIISEACNSVVLSHDPTAHAEIAAIRGASSVLMTHDLSNCTLYTSCEPCPMCLGAIYWSGIKRVIYACDRRDAEEAGFSDNLIYEEISLEPDKRKISFIRSSDAEGKEVFKAWNNFDEKIQY